MSNDDDLAEVVGKVGRSGAYALDTEFHRERTYYAHLAMLQVAWDGETALIDPLAVDMHPFADVLRRDAPCLMHAAAQDLAILERACGTLPAQLVDTQIAAGFVGLGSPGLAALLQHRISVELPKADRLTDWMHRPLSDAAARYAATDVAYLHELWDSLRSELEERGRLGWALAECEDLRSRYKEPADLDQAWWKIKEARRLKGRARGIAQAVAGWRERRAQELDKPIRHVLPDLAVVAIAERPPRDEKALGRIRGLDGRHLRRGAAGELMEAIADGRSLSLDELRLPDREALDPSLRPAVALASAWVAQLSRDLDLDASLLATRADIEDLVQGYESARLLSGWRGELAGGPVRQLLSGEASLTFNGGGGLVLEQRSYKPVEP